MRISSQALLYVRSVVPKQGMVTPQTSVRGPPQQVAWPARTRAAPGWSPVRRKCRRPLFALPRVRQPLFQPQPPACGKFPWHRCDAVPLPRGDEGQLRQRIICAVAAKLRGVGVNKHGGMSRILLGGILEALVFHPVGADSAKVAVARPAYSPTRWVLPFRQGAFRPPRSGSGRRKSNPVVDSVEPAEQ